MDKDTSTPAILSLLGLWALGRRKRSRDSGESPDWRVVLRSPSICLSGLISTVPLNCQPPPASSRALTHDKTRLEHDDQDRQQRHRCQKTDPHPQSEQEAHLRAEAEIG